MSDTDRSSTYLPTLVVHLCQGISAVVGVNVSTLALQALRSVEQLAMEGWVLRLIHLACVKASARRPKGRKYKRREDLMLSRIVLKTARESAERAGLRYQEYMSAALFFHCFSLQPKLSWGCLYGDEDLDLAVIKNRALTYEQMKDLSLDALDEVRKFYDLGPVVSRDTAVAETLAAQGDALARFHADTPLVQIIMELKELHAKVARQEKEISRLRSMVHQMDDCTLKVRLEELGIISDDAMQHLSRPFLEEIARQVGVEDIDRTRSGDLRRQIIRRLTELGYKPTGRYFRWQLDAKRLAELALLKKLTEGFDGSIYFNTFSPPQGGQGD